MLRGWREARNYLCLPACLAALRPQPSAADSRALSCCFGRLFIRGGGSCHRVHSLKGRSHAVSAAAADAKVVEGRGRTRMRSMHRCFRSSKLYGIPGEVHTACDLQPRLVHVRACVEHHGASGRSHLHCVNRARGLLPRRLLCTKSRSCVSTKGHRPSTAWPTCV